MWPSELWCWCLLWKLGSIETVTRTSKTNGVVVSKSKQPHTNPHIRWFGAHHYKFDKDKQGVPAHEVKNPLCSIRKKVGSNHHERTGTSSSGSLAEQTNRWSECNGHKHTRTEIKYVTHVQRVGTCTTVHTTRTLFK